MGRFRNYVSAAAGLAILAGAFTVFGPYVDQGQADPPVQGCGRCEYAVAGGSPTQNSRYC